ncbi:fimbrial protein [Burkholderia ubonensis]|uniref:fimbrial protein n=1 Tax=Burkholderia ubonensis TaxID=101571 RepID=UPI0007C85E86|nr:fimbrial protein [Burkholderia ubonensis]
MNFPHSAVASARPNRLFARVPFLAVLFAGAVLIAHDAFALTQTTAFGTKLNVPINTATGTVLSRHTIPKSALCGAASTCKVLAVALWDNGGSTLPKGPVITTNVSGISTQLLINGKPIERTDFGASGTPITVSSSLEVQLLRDSRPLASGSLAGQAGGNPSYYYICTSRPANYAYCSSVATGLAIALSADVKLIDGTCSTPAQNITLPGVAATQFKGVGSNGSASAIQSFNLRFEKCPPGYARVGYSLTPIGGAGSATNGTLPLRTGSTAKGVAIQVTDKSGLPATFDQSLKLDAYSTATGGTYTIPMIARYIQTGTAIVPGSVSGAMSVLVDYQ